MLCKKKKAVAKEQHMSIIDEVVGKEDLAYLMFSFLCPNRKPVNNLCFVSSRWNTAFGLVRAQLR